MSVAFSVVMHLITCHRGIKINSTRNEVWRCAYQCDRASIFPVDTLIPLLPLQLAARYASVSFAPPLRARHLEVSLLSYDQTTLQVAIAGFRYPHRQHL